MLLALIMVRLSSLGRGLYFDNLTMKLSLAHQLERCSHLNPFNSLTDFPQLFESDMYRIIKIYNRKFLGCSIVS